MVSAEKCIRDCKRCPHRKIPPPEMFRRDISSRAARIYKEEAVSP